MKFVLLRYNAMELPSNDIVSLGSLRMKDIASILGVHRATLYKSLKSLERVGIIKILRDNKLQILNMEALAAIAYH